MLRLMGGGGVFQLVHTTQGKLTLSFVEKMPNGRFCMGKSQSAATSIKDIFSTAQWNSDLVRDLFTTSSSGVQVRT